MNVGVVRSAGDSGSVVSRGHLRDVPELWPLRQRAHAVIVCRTDARIYRQAADRFRDMRAVLLVEEQRGALSAVLGRPSVTVVGRYGAIGLHEEAPSVERVLSALEAFELECPECGPQAWGDPGGIEALAWYPPD